MKFGFSIPKGAIINGLEIDITQKGRTMNVPDKNAYDVIEVLKKKYEAELELVYINIDTYLKNRVAIGEHPGIMEELQPLLDNAALHHDRLEVLQHYRTSRKLTIPSP